MKENWDSTTQWTCDHSYWDWASRPPPAPSHPQSEPRGPQLRDPPAGLCPDSPQWAFATSDWKSSPVFHPHSRSTFLAFIFSTALRTAKVLLISSLSLSPRYSARLAREEMWACVCAYLCTPSAQSSTCKVVGAQYIFWMNEWLLRKCILARQIKNE